MRKNKIKKIFTSIMVIISLWIFMYIFPFWSDLHTYYKMKNCSSEQTKEILNLMGVEYNTNAEITYIEHKSTWGNDTPRHFYIILFCDDSEIISDYYTYINRMAKKNSYENDYEINVKSTSEKELSIYYTYNMKRDGPPCALEQYIKKNGVRVIRMIDN